MEILATVLLILVLIVFVIIGIVLLVVVTIVKSFPKVLSTMLAAGIAFLMFGEPKKKTSPTYHKYDRGV
jgi:amino acid permease